MTKRGKVFRYTTSQPGEIPGLGEVIVLCEVCAGERQRDYRQYLRKYEAEMADPRLSCDDCGETN
jgi:hypothetical protein